MCCWGSLYWYLRQWGKFRKKISYPKKVNQKILVRVEAKIGYPEQNWDPKSVTRNKTGIQNWLPGTNPGAKIGYSDQTWDPKLVTRNKPGIQNWLPRGCQEKFIKCVWKVFGWCLDSVHILYWWCLDHVWALSEPCLDIVWSMSGQCLDIVLTVSGLTGT